MTEELFIGLFIEKAIDLFIYLILLFVAKKLIFKELMVGLCRLCNRQTPEGYRQVLKDMDLRIKKRNENTN